jgi:hypothetical protein
MDLHEILSLVPQNADCDGDQLSSGGHQIPVAMAVGSRTGAVFRRSGLSVAPRFLWECLNIQTVNPFPAPATSHPACGFPALGAPVCFVPRVMWPIVLERLSHLTIDGAGSC